MKYQQSTLYELSFLELIGAIFIRSQLIEQIMRELLQQSGTYVAPPKFERKTFGALLADLVKHYPAIKKNPVPEAWQPHHDASLYASLMGAKNVRDSAAHGDYLAHVTIKNLLPGQNAVDRLTMKAAREGATVMDEALVAIWNFRAEVKKTN